MAGISFFPANPEALADQERNLKEYMQQIGIDVDDTRPNQVYVGRDAAHLFRSL